MEAGGVVEGVDEAGVDGGSLMVPQSLLEAAKFLRDKELNFGEGNVIVPMTGDAERRYGELMERFTQERRHMETGELKYARSLMVRMPEKISKLALLSAISRQVEAPVIDAGDVIWATKFVSHVSASMLHEAQFHVSEGKFDRLKKRFLAMIQRNGGQIDRSTGLKNMNIDVYTFNKILLTLHMSDQIEEEEVGRRKTIITLK